MKKFLFLLMISAFLGCAEKDNAPEDLIEVSEFVEILSEAQIFESAKQYIAERQPRYALDKSYAYIFEKYGVSREQFRTSLEYYSKDPENFEKICDEVIVRLTEKQAESVNAAQKADS